MKARPRIDYMIFIFSAMRRRRDCARPADGRRDAVPSRRVGLARSIAGYTAIAATIPYLALKVGWISGIYIGVSDKSLLDDPTMVVVNTVTLMMDALATVVALALIRNWGMRLPAWLVVAPMWIATGLLGPIVIGAPLVAVVEAVSANRGPGSAAGFAGPVEGWVYGMVYTGFSVQGIALFVAFVLYCRVRWARLFEDRAEGHRPAAAADAVQVPLVPLARAAAVLATVYAAVRLSWAAGSTVGLASGENADPISWGLMNVVYGGSALVGAAGLLALTHPFRQGGLGMPLTAVWLGAGATFAWALWQLSSVLIGDPLGGDGGGHTALFGLTQLIGVLAGLLMGTAAAFLLAERAQ